MAKAQKNSGKKTGNGIRYAGFWIRLLALILDMIILGMPVVLVYFLFYFLNVPEMIWPFNLGWLALMVYLNGTLGGTPGKLILGLRIVNEKNELIGIPHAILRYACKVISSVIFGIGLLMVAFTGKKEGLHDRLAKTHVIYKR